MNFQIGVPNTEYTRCPVGWLGEAKVSCIWDRDSSPQDSSPTRILETVHRCR